MKIAVMHRRQGESTDGPGRWLELCFSGMVAVATSPTTAGCSVM